jgi:GTPase SAR1 family protein
LTILIAGNKSDLDESRQVDLQEAADLAKKYKLDYVEVSAKLGKNINIMFEILCKSMIKKEEVVDIKRTSRATMIDKKVIKVNFSHIEENKKKKKCC